MVHVGVAFEGKPDTPLKKLDNGYVVPDASLAETYRDHRRLVRDQVEFGERVDDFGYDYLLFPELHFSLVGANSPTPVLAQAAVAQRTDDVRLMQMANVLDWHDPVRLAERTAALDVLSGGRVDVGVGRGAPSQELESATFGQYWGGEPGDDLRGRRSFEEKYAVLVSSWTDDLVSHRGEFHQVPPTYTPWEHDVAYQYLADDASEYDPDDYFEPRGDTIAADSLVVSPPPEQQPHPPVWRSARSPTAIEWAARRGANLLSVADEFEVTAAVVDRYHDVAADAGWPDRRPEHDGDPFDRGWDADRRRGVAAAVKVFNTDVADDDTFDRWKLGQEFALSSEKATLPPEQAADVSIDAEEMIAENDSPIVGDAEEIIDGIARLRDACDYDDFAVFVTVDVPGVTFDELTTQVRAFADDVVPYFDEQSPDAA